MLCAPVLHPLRSNMQMQPSLFKCSNRKDILSYFHHFFLKHVTYSLHEYAFCHYTCSEFCLYCRRRRELWESELLNCTAVSDNKCQEELTRGVSEMNRGPYPNQCRSNHPKNPTLTRTCSFSTAAGLFCCPFRGRLQRFA